MEKEPFTDPHHFLQTYKQTYHPTKNSEPHNLTIYADTYIGTLAHLTPPLKPCFFLASLELNLVLIFCCSLYIESQADICLSYMPTNPTSGIKHLTIAAGIHRIASHFFFGVVFLVGKQNFNLLIHSNKITFITTIHK